MKKSWKDFSLDIHGSDLSAVYLTDGTVGTRDRSDPSVTRDSKFSYKTLLVKHIPLIIVLLIAGGLRFYRLRDLTTFGGDQGIDYQRVAQMIVDRRISLLGPITHVGIYLGPLYYYLLTPFFLLFRFDPIAAPVMFAIFGTATVGLVYQLMLRLLSLGFKTRELGFGGDFFPSAMSDNSRADVRKGKNLATIGGSAFGRSEGVFASEVMTDSRAAGKTTVHESHTQTAFLAALLYAVSPVILESSRAPSQPHLIPFFTTLLLISLIAIIENRATRWEVLAIGVSLASVIQFHFLTFPLFIFTAIVLLAQHSIYLNIWSVRNFWLYFLTPFIFLIPWFIFELRHNFFITNQIISYLGTGEIGFQPLNYVVRVVQVIWHAFDTLVGQRLWWLTATSILVAVIGAARYLHDLKVRWLVIYLIINVLGISLYFDPFSNHYISALYPAVSLMTALGIVRLLVKPLAFIAFILLITIIFTRNNFSRDYGYTMPAGVTTSLIQHTAKTVTADHAAIPGSFNFVNTLDGDTRGNPYRYVLTYVEKTPPESIDRYGEVDYLYIVAREGSWAGLRDQRWELASFPVGEIADMGLVGDQITLYRWKNARLTGGDLRK